MYLLDTCTFIWSCVAPERLPKKVADIIQNDDNNLYISIVSVWEIVLKYSKNQLDLPMQPDEFIPSGRQAFDIHLLSIDEQSCYALQSLPALHNDPADRLLICQAKEKSLAILTPDRDMKKYNIKTIWQK